MTSPLLAWIRAEVDGWEPSAVGVFREKAEHDWPISAFSEAELREKLTSAGHLMPLPTEPAALANVMEIELRARLVEAASNHGDLLIREGTQRSYPDLEFEELGSDGGVSAVDIKCARRKTPRRLNNAIALYTGNTWFLWPQLKFSGILRPYIEYQEHLALLVLYDFDSTLPERIKNVTVVAHETWRIASTKRASSTREYIGSVTDINDLVNGRGEFESAGDFYDYWRAPARRWKESKEPIRLLRNVLDEHGH